MKLSKKKSRFVCRECGAESAGWLGRCPECKAWNSLAEEQTEETEQKSVTSPSGSPESISRIDISKEDRLTSGIAEFDRVLGGGLVPGSVVLIGGEPGIGKSTLLLEAGQRFSLKDINVLYISGEESMKQIKLRASRLCLTSEKLYVVCESHLEAIIKHIRNTSARVAIVDSIQTMYREDISGGAGSISQVREVGYELVCLAKQGGISIILIGHLTKEGSIAGPRLLEHMVDTVLYFEGEEQRNYRILRSVKNRFGSTNEIGVFEMTEKGLIEVPNPSEIFLTEHPRNIAGSVVTACLEGSRTFLVELQALVSPTSFGMPRRTVSGVDYNRASLLLAVLEKRGGLRLQNQDIFINAAGGARITEPAADLAIAVAVASSLKDAPIPHKTVAIGEVGLGGEIRGVKEVEKRIKEVEKLGFLRCLIPQSSSGAIKSAHTIELIPVSNITQALKSILGK